MAGLLILYHVVVFHVTTAEGSLFLGVISLCLLACFWLLLPVMQLCYIYWFNQTLFNCPAALWFSVAPKASVAAHNGASVPGGFSPCSGQFPRLTTRYTRTLVQLTSLCQILFGFGVKYLSKSGKRSGLSWLHFCGCREALVWSLSGLPAHV